MHCVTHVYVNSYTEFLNDFVPSGLSSERTALRHHRGLAVPLLFAVTKKKSKQQYSNKFPSEILLG